MSYELLERFVEGYDAKDTFETEKNNDILNYGIKEDNGAFSQCNLAYFNSNSDIYDTFFEEYNIDLAHKKLDELDVKNAVVWDLGIVGYDIITYSKSSNEINPRFEIKYSIYSNFTKKIAEFNTQEEAQENILMLLKEKRFNTKNLSIKCEYILSEEDTNTMESYDITTKRVSGFPSSIDVNQTFHEVHKYYISSFVEI